MSIFQLAVNCYNVVIQYNSMQHKYITWQSQTYSNMKLNQWSLSCRPMARCGQLDLCL